MKYDFWPKNIFFKNLFFLVFRLVFQKSSTFWSFSKNTGITGIFWPKKQKTDVNQSNKYDFWTPLWAMTQEKNLFSTFRQLDAFWRPLLSQLLQKSSTFSWLSAIFLENFGPFHKNDSKNLMSRRKVMKRPPFSNAMIQRSSNIGLVASCGNAFVMNFDLSKR